MSQEDFSWIGSVIAAHPERTATSTKLQHAVRLLQHLGMPTRYVYRTQFQGPYSQDLHSDIRLMQQRGLVRVEEREDADWTYTVQVTPQAELAKLGKFRASIDRIAQAEPVVVELAATYDVYRQRDCSHEEVLDRLCLQKGDKLTEERQQAAMELLDALGLPAA